jgi:release factor glutamine methyltransferase
VSWQISGDELARWRDNALSAAKASGIDPQEVDWFLREVTGLDKLSLRLRTFPPSLESSYSLAHLSRLWAERLHSRSPVQYLAGSTTWRNFHLKVTHGVLIPRPETEYLIDIVSAAVKTSPDLDSGHWADLGTGSGAIAIGLSSILTNAQIHAVDVSRVALAIAAENIKSLNYTDRIHLYQGSWWTPLQSLRGKITGMISNPPYIPSPTLEDLQPEVINHEPTLALDGGEDGLTSIRHLVSTSGDYLRPDGVWLIEIMAGQGARVASLLEQDGNYESVTVIDDFAGFDRYVLARRKSCP